MTIVAHQRDDTTSPKFVIYGLRLRESTEYRYIGLTTRGASRRFYMHLWNAHSARLDFPVYRWMRKYYIPGHVVCDLIEILDSEEIDYLKFREKFWIAYFKEAHHRLLNMTEGGDGTIGVSINPDQRAAHSRRMSGEGNPMYGRVFSEEHRKNISAGLTGKPSWAKGKKFTEEHRRKISLNHYDISGKNHPNYGKKHSEELKENLRRGSHRRWHTNRNILKPGCIYCEERI